MANTDLQDAWIDDIQIEMETIDDTFANSIARYEYPYADGADLEPMGQKAHSGKVRCYFWDAGGHITYDAHIILVGYLAKKALFDLHHPQYGVMQIQIDTIAVRHDERRRTAQVDIDYVEQMRQGAMGFIGPPPADDVEATIEAAFMDSQDEQAAELAGDLHDESLDISTALDPNQSILAQVGSVANTVRTMAKELDTYLAAVDAVQNQILQPVNSLIATVNYGANLPGRVLGKMVRSVERVARLFDSLAAFPARFTNSLAAEYTRLISTISAASVNHSRTGEAARSIMARHLRIACARQLALETAYIYAADQDKRRELIRTENVASFSIEGKYLGAGPVDQVANSRELETSLADARTLIEAAIMETRSQAALKTMALLLLDHVNTVKLDRERIITIELDNPTPLHLVCLKYGLPYNTAPRIATINPALANPTFATGSIQIYLPGGSQ